MVTCKTWIWRSQHTVNARSPGLLVLLSGKLNTVLKELFKTPTLPYSPKEISWLLGQYVITELGRSRPEMISTIVRIRIDFGRLDPEPDPGVRIRVRPFHLKNFLLISEIKRIWIRFTCVSLFHYKISLLFFRFFSLIFASNFSLRFTLIIRSEIQVYFFRFFLFFFTFFRFFCFFLLFFALTFLLRFDLVIFAFFRLIFISLRFFRLIFASLTFVFASDFWCFASSESCEIRLFFRFQAKRNFRFNFKFRFRSESEGAP